MRPMLINCSLLGPAFILPSRDGLAVAVWKVSKVFRVQSLLGKLPGWSREVSEMAPEIVRLCTLDDILSPQESRLESGTPLN